MANRHTLHVDRLGDFERWLSNNGWEIEEPKEDYEVLRARKPDRKRPLILWRRLSNNGGGELTHLTYDDRDGGVIAAFIKDTRKRVEEVTLADLLDFVKGREVEITFLPNFGGSDRLVVRAEKWDQTDEERPIPYRCEAYVPPANALLTEADGAWIAIDEVTKKVEEAMNKRRKTE